ncbi:hypothetical protein BDV93DRAFT_565012 [Ceratobasidium sp. AG-I]|nr:hypothetical protein BDV93DRAFT_565012 [Ceratobasidium sp. AG-I]
MLYRRMSLSRVHANAGRESNALPSAAALVPRIRDWLHSDADDRAPELPTYSSHRDNAQRVYVDSLELLQRYPNQHDPRDGCDGHTRHVDHDYSCERDLARLAGECAFSSSYDPWAKLLWEGDRRRSQSTRVRGKMQTEEEEDARTEIGPPEMAMGEGDVYGAHSMSDLRLPPARSFLPSTPVYPPSGAAAQQTHRAMRAGAVSQDVLLYGPAGVTPAPAELAHNKACDKIPPIPSAIPPRQAIAGVCCGCAGVSCPSLLGTALLARRIAFIGLPPGVCAAAYSPRPVHSLPPLSALALTTWDRLPLFPCRQRLITHHIGSYWLVGNVQAPTFPIDRVARRD